jgi:hypothetical protein
MPRWMKPSEEMPKVEVGDRIVIIVRERAASNLLLRPRLVVLEAEENGWHSPDSFYTGYTPMDGVLWATEKSVCEIADLDDSLFPRGPTGRAVRCDEFIDDAGSLSDQCPVNP